MVAPAPPAVGEGTALVEAFRGDVARQSVSTRKRQSRIAMRAMPRASSGRSSRRPSRATSLLIFHCATNHLTAPTPATTVRTVMRTLLLEALLKGSAVTRRPDPDACMLAEAAAALAASTRRRIGRSLAIREVDAGSCNGCELEFPCPQQSGLRHRAFRPEVRCFAPPRGCAAGDGPGHMEHAASSSSAPTLRHPSQSGWSPLVIAPRIAASLPEAQPAPGRSRR